MNSKRIALVAHDHKKQAMLSWAETNKEKLQAHILYATGTTGKILEKALNMKIEKLKSGPLGGDQQIGALIADQQVDILFFFWETVLQL